MSDGSYTYVRAIDRTDLDRYRSIDRTTDLDRTDLDRSRSIDWTDLDRSIDRSLEGEFSVVGTLAMQPTEKTIKALFHNEVVSGVCCLSEGESGIQ